MSVPDHLAWDVARRLAPTFAGVLVAVAALASPVVAAEIPGTNGARVPELVWGPCPPDATEDPAYQCTTVDVPLSYRDPAGPTIELALGRLPAADASRRLGTLFWDPGGPGGSGRIPPPFTDALHERFDFVGFDPRGIAASTPLACFETEDEASETFDWPFPITREQERDVFGLSQRGTERCAENGGPILGHMSTANVARDLDLLRQAVGDEQLTYYGVSYGTHIGEVYANLFPDRVRALVIDGVIDPVEWTTGRTPAEGRTPPDFRMEAFLGTQAALESLLDACAADARCAFREEGRDLRAKYATLLDRLRRRPLETNGPDGPRTITYQDVVAGTTGALYNAGSSLQLAAGLQAAWVATERRDRGAVIHAIGQMAAEELVVTGAETYSAVECLDSDHATDPRDFPRFARRADRSAPGFGSLQVYLSLACATWPASDPDRYIGPWDRPTANPILVIGNRKGDPATPYEDAVSTTARLADARLLTFDEFGHGAFMMSQCIDAAVERYLIDIELPPEATVCQPDRGPFDPVPEAVAHRRGLLHVR